MADPLSISASVLAVITAAAQSIRSLNDTIKRYKDRDKTLGRLEHQLEDLLNVLKTLEQVSNHDSSMLSLLRGPVSRCAQTCHDFEVSIKDFKGKTKTGFLDWAKMEFMRGDIHDFIDTLMGYKSTIAVGLGTITMHTSKVSQQVLEEYSEMIKDTTYSLNLHLQRIDEKMALLSAGTIQPSDNSIDLKDERAVTKQCLRICENAESCLESLMNGEPSLQNQTLLESPADVRSLFEAQLLTRKTMEDYRDSLAETIGRMRGRLESLDSDDTLNGEVERSRLQKDIDMSRECLEVCKTASREVANQKIHTVGEAIAEGNSDQVVITTLADLFDVRKASSKDSSAQLVGSTDAETLRKISGDRYNSRFGAVPTVDSHTYADVQKGGTRVPEQRGKETKQPSVEAKDSKKWPNESRKRMME